MISGPYATFINKAGTLFSVHHSAVIAVIEDREAGEAGEAGETYLIIRIGNSGESYKVQTPYGVVMRELERARRAEIVSFGE